MIFSRCVLQEDILTLLDDEFGREYELDVAWNAVLAESYLYRCKHNPASFSPNNRVYDAPCSYEASAGGASEGRAAHVDTIVIMV